MTNRSWCRQEMEKKLSGFFTDFFFKALIPHGYGTHSGGYVCDLSYR